ncbi:Retrovirus-related Pol polyprotein from transposon RE1 [Vitis vinifera]|uniref:Retrovirus-related Pol polyprotein from transposon RE1 n=1 Tax=Vitis vinifera TaxID=29760 RepID=A0A438KJQ2_VITVI|nr:Retrovirus-related Pol polyprotein from transposon RE1 [Vitis vinifera]
MLGKQTAAATTESSALAARANNATTSSTSQPKSNPLSKEQLDLLQKPLQQSQQPKPPQPPSIIGTGSVAQKIMDSGMMIGNAKMHEGLYLLQANEYPNPNHSQANNSQAHSVQPSISVLSIRSDNKNDVILLWHYGLGHPNFVDIWVPSRIKNISGSRWFVTFIDDHTRLTWIFLMMDKSEGEVVLTTAYLINRMPSRTLNYQSPCQVLLQSYPNSRLISSIPIKVFGCTAFVHIHSQHRSKLDPKVVKCLFLGYSPSQKGYDSSYPSSSFLPPETETSSNLQSEPIFETTQPSQSSSNTTAEPLLDEVSNDLDFPIALRKGVRSCTKHPIQNFVSYNELSPSYRAFAMKITEVKVPTTIHEALSQSDWRKAIFYEMSAWKDRADESVERLKARLVAKGFTQAYGALNQLDVKNAFLNGDLEEEAYMEIPPSFEGNNDFNKEFEIKDLGDLKYFLGMEVAWSKKGICISQRKCILDLLEETGMLGCKPLDIPMDSNVKLGLDQDSPSIDKGQYQQLVGKLIYLSHTRPDIEFSVSLVSKFMNNPTKEHLDVVYRILQYLKRAPREGLFFKKNPNREIMIYPDADWVGSPIDCRSTSGYCSYVWSNLVTWQSKKQTVLARSSTEAKFRALANGICEGMWIMRLLEELKFSIDSPMRIFCDNQAAIRIAKKPAHHDKTKHVEIDCHFTKEKID